MAFWLHGEIILFHSVECWCQNVWLFPPLCHLYLITTCQTSFENLVTAVLISPLISRRPSGLQGEETRTGNYNRLFVGKSAKVWVALNMSHERSSSPLTTCLWWIPSPHGNMGHDHTGSSDNTDQSSPAWFSVHCYFVAAACKVWTVARIVGMQWFWVAPGQPSLFLDQKPKKKKSTNELHF